MTLYELLQTPLLKNAKVEYGRNGLESNVTWCSPDVALRFDNWIIPGLLLVFTGELEESEFESVRIALRESNAAGILIFGQDTLDMETLYGQNVECYNRMRLPIIQMPSYTNILSFTKQLSVVLATNFESERYVENWLREICYSSDRLYFHDMMTERFGYQSQKNYICMLLQTKRKKKEHSVGIDLDLKQAEGIMINHMALENERVLSFIDGDKLIAFLSFEEGRNRTDIHAKLKDIFQNIKLMLSDRSWFCTVGSIAKNLDEFRQTYLDAVQTAQISYSLDNQIHFYDEWYTHLFVLKASKEDRRELITQVLEPLLDKPELLEILIEYYTYGENIKTTSEHLFVHINTVKYRLKKIESILGVDLKNSNTRFRLQMAIIAYQHWNTHST